MLCMFAYPQAYMQTKKEGVVGVLLTTDKDITAFTVGEDSEPVPIEVNLERRGLFSQGYIVNEESLQNDPKRKLYEMIREMTSVPTASTEPALKKQKAATTVAADVDACAPECPDGTGAEQALWFTEQFLRKQEGPASMRAIFAMLAHKCFSGHTEKFLRANFQVQPGPKKLVSMGKPTVATEQKQPIELPQGEEIPLTTIGEVAKIIPQVQNVVASLMMSNPGGIHSEIRKLVDDWNANLSLPDDFSAIRRHSGFRAVRRHLKPAARRLRRERLAKKQIRALFFPKKKIYKSKKNCKEGKKEQTETIGDRLDLEVAQKNSESGAETGRKRRKENLPIWEKMKILQWADNLALDGVTAIEAQTMAAFPASLTSVGQLGRWRRSSILYHWKMLPMTLATHAKEVPNWLRFSLHMEKQKGRTEDWFIPMVLQVQYDKVLNARINDCSSNDDINELLLIKNVQKGMKEILHEYNQAANLANEKIDKKNLATYKAWEEEKITNDEAKDSCE